MYLRLYRSWFPAVDSDRHEPDRLICLKSFWGFFENQPPISHWMFNMWDSECTFSFALYVHFCCALRRGELFCRRHVESSGFVIETFSKVVSWWYCRVVCQDVMRCHAQFDKFHRIRQGSDQLQRFKIDSEPYMKSSYIFAFGDHNLEEEAMEMASSGTISQTRQSLVSFKYEKIEIPETQRNISTTTSAKHSFCLSLKIFVFDPHLRCPFPDSVGFNFWKKSDVTNSEMGKILFKKKNPM